MHYRYIMGEARAILDFGRWVASRPAGSATLGWSDGVLVLDIRDGKIVGVSGPNPQVLTRTFGTNPPDGDDLIALAQAMAPQSGLSEIQAVGAVKSILLDSLQLWFMDPDRSFDVSDTIPESRSAHSISATHALVELVLSSPDDTIVHAILPDRNVLLTRTEGFLDLYAPLGLAEEADLIVAKITGQRTGAEIEAHSPHPKDEVARLLAALTATGMLTIRDPDPPSIGISLGPEPEPTPSIEEHAPQRRLSPLILFVPALAVVAAAFAVWWFFFRAPADVDTKNPPSAHWGVVVDLGCEPHEYRRLMQVARLNDEVRPIAVEDVQDSSEDCWRLVWGDFSTAALAERAFPKVPAEVRRDGFELHAVEIPSAQNPLDSGE